MSANTTAPATPANVKAFSIPFSSLTVGAGIAAAYCSNLGVITELESKFPALKGVSRGIKLKGDGAKGKWIADLTGAGVPDLELKKWVTAKTNIDTLDAVSAMFALPQSYQKDALQKWEFCHVSGKDAAKVEAESLVKSA